MLENKVSTENIEKLIVIHKKAQLIWENSFLYTKKVIVDSEIIDLLIYLDGDECNITTVTIDRIGANLIDHLKINETISIKIVITRSLGIFYGKNLNDLLTTSNKKYCSEIPRLCYLSDENWKSWEDKEQKQSIHSYVELIKFVRLLKTDISDHDDNTVLHFFGASEKVSFPLIFSAEKIESNQGVILNSLAVINTLMDGENYRKDKAIQLKAIIIDITKNIGTNSRFDFLIENIDKLSTRFAHNHDLFVSGFSFDDKKELLKSENRKFTSELNNTINSIHTRVISIPIGTIGASILLKSNLVASQNLELFVLASSIFIVVIIAISLFSQYLLLKKIRNEYKGKWGRMKIEIPTLEKELKSEYKNLEKHFYLNQTLIVFFAIALFWFSWFPITTYFDLNYETIMNFIANK